MSITPICSDQSSQQKNSTTQVNSTTPKIATFVQLSNPLVATPPPSSKLPTLGDRLDGRMFLPSVHEQPLIEENETSPLHIAVYLGSLEEVKKLLTEGADISATNLTCNTAETLAKAKITALKSAIWWENNFKTRRPCAHFIEDYESRIKIMTEILNLVKLDKKTE